MSGLGRLTTSTLQKYPGSQEKKAEREIYFNCTHEASHMIVTQSYLRQRYPPPQSVQFSHFSPPIVFFSSLFALFLLL